MSSSAMMVAPGWSVAEDGIVIGSGPDPALLRAVVTRAIAARAHRPCRTVHLAVGVFRRSGKSSMRWRLLQPAVVELHLVEPRRETCRCDATSLSAGAKYQPASV